MREEVLEQRPGPDAQIVDRGDEQDRAHRDGHAEIGREARQGQRVVGEGDRDRRDGAGGDDQQQRPAVEEGREGAPGFPEVDVAAARARPVPAQLLKQSALASAMAPPSTHARTIAAGDLEPLRHHRRSPEDASPTIPPITAMLPEKRPSRRA
jgi:hypothetical protein